jgi:hypothetical protein
MGSTLGLLTLSFMVWFFIRLTHHREGKRTYRCGFPTCREDVRRSGNRSEAGLPQWVHLDGIEWKPCTWEEWFSTYAKPLQEGKNPEYVAAPHPAFPELEN